MSAWVSFSGIARNGRRSYTNGESENDGKGPGGCRLWPDAEAFEESKHWTSTGPTAILLCAKEWPIIGIVLSHMARGMDKR